jgi:gas vesicle protein
MSENPHIDKHNEKADRFRKVGTGIGGGLVGAAIGGLLGRRYGGVFGGVVGAVAGTLVGKATAQRVDRTVDSLVDAAKTVADAVNHSVSGVGNALKDTVEQVKPSVVSVVETVKDTVEQVRPSVVATVDAVENTVEQVRPSVVATVDAVKDTVEQIRPSVVTTVDAVKDTVEQVRPSIVDAAKDIAEAVNHNVNEVGNALKDTISQVQETEISSSSSSSQYEDPTPSVPVPMSTGEEALEAGFRNYTELISDSKLIGLEDTPKDTLDTVQPSIVGESTEVAEGVNQNLSNVENTLKSTPEEVQPSVTRVEEDTQVTPDEYKSVNDNSQLHQEQQLLTSTQELSRTAYTSNHEDSLSPTPLSSSQITGEAVQQLPQQRTLQTSNNQKLTGIILGASILILAGLGLGFRSGQKLVETKLPQSGQSLNSASASAPILDKSPDGWIFLGSTKYISDSILFGKPLIEGSQSTDSPVIPSVGSVVTVTAKPGVTLRKNRPQPPSFSYQEQAFLAVVKPNQKLKIINLEFITPNSTNQPETKVWAQVQRCASTCN